MWQNTNRIEVEKKDQPKEHNSYLITFIFTYKTKQKMKCYWETCTYFIQVVQHCNNILLHRVYVHKVLPKRMKSCYSSSNTIESASSKYGV